MIYFSELGRVQRVRRRSISSDLLISSCMIPATHNRLQFEITYYPDSLLFISAGFLPRISSAAATTKPLRRRPDRTLLLLLQMSGYVHPNPCPATNYPCPICARNVTSRGVSYQCNRCSGWVHAKCSGL